MENKETVPEGKIVQIMSMSRSGIWDWFTPDKDLQNGCLQEAIRERLPHRFIDSTPATDELNLGENMQAWFDGMADSGYSRETIFKAGYQQRIIDEQQSHHNHASFVALVEGEIAELEASLNGAPDIEVIQINAKIIALINFKLKVL